MLHIAAVACTLQANSCALVITPEAYTDVKQCTGATAMLLPDLKRQLYFQLRGQSYALMTSCDTEKNLRKRFGSTADGLFDKMGKGI